MDKQEILVAKIFREDNTTKIYSYNVVTSNWTNLLSTKCMLGFHYRVIKSVRSTGTTFLNLEVRLLLVVLYTGLIFWRRMNVFVI